MNVQNVSAEWNCARREVTAEDAWDRQFEEDVMAGKLDFLKGEVEQAKREGRLGIL